MDTLHARISETRTSARIWSPGPAGTLVVITGTNFTGATLVKFVGVKATFIVVSGTTITAPVPAGAATGKIVVKTPVGSSTSLTKFTVT